MDDERQAEAMYLIVVSMLLLMLLLAQYLTWALLGSTMQADPATLLFWGAQGVGVVLFVLLGILGFKPAVTVTIEPEGLHLCQGKRTCAVPYDEMDTVEPLEPLLFHRHYARYAATQTFVSQRPTTLLLIKTAADPIVVGLRPEDHLALLHHLQAELTPTFDLPTARVA
ncbi:MAG TPA: hypothetical protein VKP65_25390 [Rhodothermales bacterium]|nr:hypothetical protein [Rhodothermales bacterium]